jgi:hypothetical protein
MAINFPDNPVNGSTYDYEGVRFIFKDTGEAGYWQVGSLGAVGAATTEQVDEGTDALKFVTPDSLEGSKYTVEDGTYTELRAQGTTKSDVGLSNVANFGISDSRTTNSSTQYASSKAARDLYTTKAEQTGDYSGLRARSTTKTDVGLSNVPNSVSNSVTSSSTTTLATSKAAKSAYDRGNLGYVRTPYYAGHAAVGALTFAAYVNGSSYSAKGDISINMTTSGGNLSPCGMRNNKNSSGTAAGSVTRPTTRYSGTWKSLGNANYYGNDSVAVTLWLRIS